ncbi:MAG: 5-oxoprolinase subunit PxpB [Bacteroidota bacterium]
MSNVRKSLKFIPYGDRALLINILEEDLLIANEKVIQLTHLIQKSAFSGITEIVPATNSITIVFDTFNVSVDHLVENIKSLLIKTLDTVSSNAKLIELPICYDPEFALDMDIVCDQTGLSSDKLIETHLGTTFRVMMTGFMPGFFYLGQLPENIDIERKPSPRKKIRSGSVGLAGRQTGIYSTDSPGGWQIIGKSINLLDQTLKKKLQINLGDQVKFKRVSQSELQNWFKNDSDS